MKKMFVAACLVMYCCLLSAQNVAEDKSQLNLQRLLDELKGTYELRYSTRAMSLLPSNLAEIIEQNRKEAEVNILRLNDNVEVIIYPRNQIVNYNAKIKE